MIVIASFYSCNPTYTSNYTRSDKITIEDFVLTLTFSN